MSATAPGPAVSRPVENRTLPAVVYGLFLLSVVNSVLTVAPLVPPHRIIIPPLPLSIGTLANLGLFAGLILAYANRPGAGPAMRTHYSFQIRTFWTAFVLWGLGMLLLVLSIFGLMAITLSGVGLLLGSGLLLSLTAIWFTLRCILGVAYLSRGRPYPRPRTWLV